MQRRDFLVRTGLALGAGAFTGFGRAFAGSPAEAPARAATLLEDWDAVRAQFNLSRDHIHLASFFLASHPKPVREAIDRHRRGLDESPIGYWFENIDRFEADVLGAAAQHQGVQPTDIALTDSTTMGLGLLYGGLKLRQGQEILTTRHDHYSTEISLQKRAERTGTTVRSIPLYERIEAVTEDEIVQSILKALTPRTRVVAVTWVHSSTGLKLPIRKIADALAPVNAQRDPADRALLCVDGVHGLGIEDVTLPELGCDFFVAGTHKWLFGPRGTGFVWGKPQAWPAASAIIPTFNHDAYEIWMKTIPPKEIPISATMTPGGFHSFEHRWALADAFRFHGGLGKERIAARTHELNRHIKEGLAKITKVRLLTPMSDSLSSGIVCFEIDGMKPQAAVDRLMQRRIIASETPYATQYVRVAASVLNTPEEMDATLREIRSLV
ncbi:MAG: aminotransferase [Acidobacteria bacterium]|nr:MAG: aminotransferase [Acidobacteriota bacterium]